MFFLLTIIIIKDMIPPVMMNRKEVSMDTRYINHRRTRQQIRRILADIVVRGRDLSGSYFPTDFDLFDHQHRNAVNDNRDAAVAAQVQR